jgi:hypothetical protein
MSLWLLHDHGLEILALLDFSLDFLDDGSEVWQILYNCVSRVVSSSVWKVEGAPPLVWSALL